MNDKLVWEPYSLVYSKLEKTANERLAEYKSNPESWGLGWWDLTPALTKEWLDESRAVGTMALTLLNSRNELLLKKMSAPFILSHPPQVVTKGIASYG